MPTRVVSREYWGPISGVGVREDGLLSFQTASGIPILVQSIMTKLRPPGPSPAHPYMKYLRWNTVKSNRVALSCESRAADGVPFDAGIGACYLVLRKDSGRLALPGGFIDVADGIGTDLTLSQITLNAARRELAEEAGGTSNHWISLGGQVQEFILPSVAINTREVITVSYPWAAAMPMQSLHPADDAAQAPGQPPLLPGWYGLEDLSKITPLLHFGHHAVILERLQSLWLTGAAWTPQVLSYSRTKWLKAQRAYYWGQVLGDYKLIIAGGEPVLSTSMGNPYSPAQYDFWQRYVLQQDW